MTITIKACDPNTTASPSISKPSFRGLRLVVGGSRETRKHEEWSGYQALPCAYLKSAIAAEMRIIAHVLTDLFKGLRQGERIEFVHRIVRPATGNAAGLPSYRLVVKLA